jgi:TRAP-type C4-dicarboxylate transport system permease small subunit
MGVLRRSLDRLYLAAGILAGFFLISIGVLVLLSIVTRLLGVYVAGLTDYAGYAMASCSFLALAYTFGQGGHIRVALFVEKLSGARRRAAELWCLAVGTFLAGYLAWFSVKMVRVSHMLGDVSESADATPSFSACCSCCSAAASGWPRPARGGAGRHGALHQPPGR